MIWIKNTQHLGHEIKNTQYTIVVPSVNAGQSSYKVWYFGYFVDVDQSFEERCSGPAVYDAERRWTRDFEFHCVVQKQYPYFVKDHQHQSRLKILIVVSWLNRELGFP